MGTWIGRCNKTNSYGNEPGATTRPSPAPVLTRFSQATSVSQLVAMIEAADASATASAQRVPES